METLYSFEADVPAGRAFLAPRFAPTISPNSIPQIAPDHLFSIVEAAADRALPHSWTAIPTTSTQARSAHDLLVLLTFAYLRGVYHSSDVVQLLDDEDALLSIRLRLGLRSEQLRHFRRKHRDDLIACLTDSVSRMMEAATNPPHSAWDFRSYERPRFDAFAQVHPARLAALEVFDRAVSLDSMALDE